MNENINYILIVFYTYMVFKSWHAYYGIYIMVWHFLLTGTNEPYISLNSSTYSCSYQPGCLAPQTSVYACNITNENFDRLLEDGDK